jgi:hypothetical protein
VDRGILPVMQYRRPVHSDSTGEIAGKAERVTQIVVHRRVCGIELHGAAVRLDGIRICTRIGQSLTKIEPCIDRGGMLSHLLTED